MHLTATISHDNLMHVINKSTNNFIFTLPNQAQTISVLCVCLGNGFARKSQQPETQRREELFSQLSLAVGTE